MTAGRYEDERYDDDCWLDFDEDGEPVRLMRFVFTGGQIRPATDLPDIALYEPAES